MLLFKRLKSVMGSATSMVMIISSVIVLIAISVVRIGQGTGEKDFQHIRFYSTIELLKANVFAIIDNSVAWNNTIAYNQALGSPRMACIGTASCVVNTWDLSFADEANTITYLGERIYLRDKSDATVYDPLDNTWGYTINGTKCSTYSKASVVGGCAIRMRVAWRPFCPLAPPTCPVPTNSPILLMHFFTPAKKVTGDLVPGILFNPEQTDGIVPDTNDYR